MMGCTDPSSSTGLHVPSASLAACMIAAGIRPDQDPLLMSLVKSYRAFALKNVQVHHSLGLNYSMGLIL
jgi:hypothetical protein